MPRKLRSIRVEGNVAYVTLTKGYTAIIDAEDAHLVDGTNWSATVSRHSDGSIRAVYAQGNARIGARYKSVMLHRIILNAPEDVQCDHIDGNGLDNRRSNLRLASHAENCRNTRIRRDNTSGAKGVSWNASRGKWRAEIMVNRRKMCLGRFNDIADAADAYATASAKFHGEFGRPIERE